MGPGTPNTENKPSASVRTISQKIKNVSSLILATGNVQKQKTKKSNVASSASFAIGKPLNPLENVSDKRWKSLREKSMP